MKNFWTFIKEFIFRQGMLYDVLYEMVYDEWKKEDKSSQKRKTNNRSLTSRARKQVISKILWCKKISFEN